MRRKCINCGKAFTAKSRNAKYCPKCRAEMRHRESQPCWTCDNYASGCSWSRNFTPVKGWVAEKVEHRYSNIADDTTYKIIYCPEYANTQGCEDI